MSLGKQSVSGVEEGVSVRAQLGRGDVHAWRGLTLGIQGPQHISRASPGSLWVGGQLGAVPDFKPGEEPVLVEGEQPGRWCRSFSRGTMRWVQADTCGLSASLLSE